MEASQISVVSIPVSDQDRAKAFYVDVLGFEVQVDTPMGEGARWVMLRPRGGGASIALVTWFPRMQPGSLSGTVLSVGGIEEAVNHLRERGARAADAQIQEAAWGRWVTIQDPDGNGWVIQENR